MITSTTRPLTDSEKKTLKRQLPSGNKRFEGVVIKLIFIALLLDIPLLIYDHFIPVPSNIQAIYCIAMVVVAIGLTIWVTKKWEGGFTNTKEIAEIDKGQAEVFHVKTTRAIKREDPEDFGVAFYLEVFENGKPKTLYLWGQYLDDLEDDNIFPNTEFEYSKKIGSDDFIDFSTLGTHFKEEKTLPPFGQEVWKSGVYPVNGQILEQTLDDIK